MNAADQTARALDDLAQDLPALSQRWHESSDWLSDFMERWEDAWNSHDLDRLQDMVTTDIRWEDPAMHGQIVHGREEFRAFTATFFDAFPDVRLEGDGATYLALEGMGLALPWRMTGTFTGELALWGGPADSEPPLIAPTGCSFDLRGIDLYEFRDGLIGDWRIIYDLTDFSRQIGLLG